MEFIDNCGCETYYEEPAVYVPPIDYSVTPSVPMPAPSLDLDGPAIPDVPDTPVAPGLLMPEIPSPVIDDPYEPYNYDSTSRDSDADGEVDAFDSDPNIPYNDSSLDADSDGEADRFDSAPTSPYDDPSMDADYDMEPDAFDSAPTNSYDD